MSNHQFHHDHQSLASLAAQNEFNRHFWLLSNLRQLEHEDRLVFAARLVGMRDWLM